MDYLKNNKSENTITNKKNKYIFPDIFVKKEEE